jgi:hypothetical protein
MNYRAALSTTGVSLGSYKAAAQGKDQQRGQPPTMNRREESAGQLTECPHPWVAFSRDIDRAAGVPRTLSDGALSKAALVLRRALTRDTSRADQDRVRDLGGSPIVRRETAA